MHRSLEEGEKGRERRRGRRGGVCEILFGVIHLYVYVYVYTYIDEYYVVM